MHLLLFLVVVVRFYASPIQSRVKIVQLLSCRDEQKYVLPPAWDRFHGFSNVCVWELRFRTWIPYFKCLWKRSTSRATFFHAHVLSNATWIRPSCHSQKHELENCVLSLSIMRSRWPGSQFDTYQACIQDVTNNDRTGLISSYFESTSSATPCEKAVNYFINFY